MLKKSKITDLLDLFLFSANYSRVYAISFIISECTFLEKFKTNTSTCGKKSSDRIAFITQNKTSVHQISPWRVLMSSVKILPWLRFATSDTRGPYGVRCKNQQCLAFFTCTVHLGTGPSGKHRIMQHGVLGKFNQTKNCCLWFWFLWVWERGRVVCINGVPLTAKCEIGCLICDKSL